MGNQQVNTKAPTGLVLKLDVTSPSPETLKRLRAIIDEAFGRSGEPERE